MTVAFITEDENDSHVVGTFVDRILGVSLPRTHYLLNRGFGAVLKSAGGLSVAAARARCSLIVVLVDCDETFDHYESRPPHEMCRLCRLQEVLPSAQEVSILSNGCSRLIAALAVRTLETWLAVAGRMSVPGSIHRNGIASTERRELKRIVYGLTNPPSQLLRSRGVDLANGADIPLMERTLVSFARFAELVREGLAPPANQLELGDAGT